MGLHQQFHQKTLIQQIILEKLKVCNFEIKLKALKLPWVKRLVSKKDYIWTILTKLFYNCHNFMITK